MDENPSRLNDPPSVLAGPQLLHDLIRWNVHPNTCALDFIIQNRRETYRYRDIQACVAALVTRIQLTLERSRSCTQRQHIVPILLPQSPALYISELAILQSGGAFCPINLDAPKDRIKFVVGDVAADIIITTVEFQHVVSWENGPDVVVVDEFPSIPVEEEKYVPSRETIPNDLAYVMYTSGSSGTPKGVAVSHLAVSQSLLAHENIVPSFNRFLQFAAPSFDVSVFEIFFPFIRGCTLVGCDRSQLLNDLQGMINKLEIDAAELTPTVVGALLQKRSNVPGLRLLMTIGEMLTRPIVEEFGGSGTRDSILYGMYGPTEAAIHCTVYPKMQASTKYNNIGVPFRTVSAFVAEASPTSGTEDKIILLPRGELGELVLGGLQLAQGYLNREEQNRAAFINVDGKKYYRTGDKARILSDGSIEIHGRMSAGQVKLRGQRVELGEIEDAVYKHSGVKTVAAVVLGTVLVAFALVDDGRIQPEEVLHTCSQWLPNFMVPSEVVLLNQFPYLPSGKVDKRKLESDYQQKRELTDDTVGSTLVEARVREVLEEAIGSFPSSMRLAAAGVDSLVAIKVAGGLRSRGFEITTLAVLQAETFNSLVQICETSTSEASSTTISTPITDEESYITVQNEAADIEITLPCTPVQNAILAETALNRRAYRNWVEIELPGILDSEFIRRTLHSLATHNPILRTGFSELPDAHGYAQIVWKTFPDSNIEEVKTLTYEFDESRDTSLDHPVRWEILAGDVSSKLLMHIHHALYDAWSLELMLDDLELFLRSESPPPRPSFAEVVYGYIDEPLSVDTWASKDYWKDHLADLELRHMPNFNVTKNHGTGLAVVHHLTQLDTSMIETAAKSLSVSPQAIFQAAYSLILSSYLGSSDICFGIVFSGRTLPIRGIENIVGPCLTTLPIRVDISTTSTLRHLVEDLNRTTRKHLEHSTTPLRDIQSANGIEPRQALFDTLLIWQQTLHSHDHTREHVVLIDQVDQLEFKLTLEITPTRSNIHLKANYEKSIFPSSQIELLLHQVEQVVKVILENSTEAPDNVFNKLHPSVLSIENPTPNTALGSETLSSPVERIAREDPERPAIAFAESIDLEASNIQYMTYGSLNRRANQFSYYIADNHVLPNEIVCICLEKSHDFYASVLATTKIGAGYLPVTPDVPQERLRHILHEANVKLLIGHSRSASLLQDFTDVKTLYLDEVDWSSFSNENLPSAFNPDYLSYCVFTSGSTGTPKGVMVTQGNLVSNLDVLVDLYPASKDSRLLQACSQAFDVSVFEIFFTWRIGGCLCSATKDVLFRDIENTIRVLDVTHLSLTPTVAALIDPQNVPRVEFLVTAGEAVTQKVFNMWADHGLYQGYGPSETTNICTVKSKVSRNDYINNIGHAFRNTSTFVLARTPGFSLVPRGSEGEFCFGGSQVFRGYMDQAQEEGRIIDHPKFGRLYRSGDFGRLMPDGSLAFTGRKDDQVKIRGQRVELGEISSILLSLPYVLDCVAMVITSEDNLQRLVCFWASTFNDSENSNLDAILPDQATLQSLYKELQSRLPHYMVPSALIPVSQLPSTPQGKIDKRRLVKLYESLDLGYLNSTSMESRSALDHKWTEVELEIRNVLSKLTDCSVDDISPDTSFFSLGIDSISAVKFSRCLRDMTGRQVEISDILKHSSVVRLAERMSAFREMDSAVQSRTESSFNFDLKFVKPTIDDFTKMGFAVEAITPCTPLQEAMLSAAESSSQSAYSNHVLLNVFGDVQKLCACWQEMVKRHEILRTCFLGTNMLQFAYVQVVLKDFRIDFGSLHASTRDDAIHEVQMRPARSQYTPPYTIDIFQSTGQTKMLVSMHHALYDGVALAVLYEEVEKLYHQSQLSPSVSFTPFLKYMSAANSNASDQFWQNCLRGYYPVSLESVSEGTALFQQTGSRVQKLRSQVPLSRIEKYTRKNNTTILSLCHAIWTRILSELLSSTDICFGNVVSGRTVPVGGVERLVAPCFNTIPTRVKDIHKLTYIETLRSLQSFNADSLAFQLTPLRRLQAKFSPDGSRLFDTLFILQQSPKDLDSSIWSIVDDIGAMDFPLVCEVVPRHSDDTLEIILHSHFSHISEEGADKILQDFDNILQAALENPRRQILSSSVREIIMSRSEERARKSSYNARPETQGSPMNSKELEVRDIISAFTDVPSETITRDASIFRLGLDSISAVQVASRLRAQGYTILASDILQRSTISRIAEFISADASNETKEVKQFDFASFDTKFRDMICSKHDIPLTDVECVRPCTAVQAGMIAQSLHSGGQDYINSVTLELAPGHSSEKIKQSWLEVCKAHEMLRTRFSQTDDSIYPFLMVTYTAQSFKFPWYEGEEDISLESVDHIRTPWSLMILESGPRILLQFRAHHALYDAQSMQMIFSDFATAYNSGNITARPSVNLLLGSILQASVVDQEEKRAFWGRSENRIVVNKFPDLTPLRVLEANQAVQEFKSTVSMMELENTCRNLGVTVQAAGQATWARLLTAYTGENVTTFGITLSGRSVCDEADLIAFPSIVTLPVNCDVTGTNADLLSMTMAGNAQLHKYQFTPLTSIQKWAGYPEGKIFDTLFAYQKLPDKENAPNPPWKVIEEKATVDYVLSLEMQPNLDGVLTLRLNFREDIVPRPQADFILRQFDMLLMDTLYHPTNSCEVAPETVAGLLSITPAQEPVLPDSITLLHQYVERGAELWPNKPALEFATCLEKNNFESQKWTYEQLDAEANKVAKLVQDRGAVPGEIIAICFDKCPEASFAIIGIMKAGCAYVALDPNAPADRLNFIIEDSSTKLVISAGRPAQNLQSCMIRNVVDLSDSAVLRDYTTEPAELSRQILPSDISYCLYTSGTTGTPKGCLLTHENAVQAMLAFQRLFAGHWTEESKWLQFASFHFDVSVLEQFWSWSVGICVASAPRDLIFEDIPGAIHQLGITHIDLTPSLARLLHPDDVPTLWKGVFITGGEQLKQEILDVWGEKGCIYNGYGPTEATIGVTMYPRVPRNGKPSNIGPQFVNVGSFVLKPGTELPVLRGGIGELCVSGKLVGKGYLNRPDLTKERFPTLKQFNERVYRTGDLVRILHDGTFLFLGRADDQVKLRGQRLELGEINEVIKKSRNDIDEVVTLVLKHSTQAKEQLVTFFVLAGKNESDDGEAISVMRDACKSRLPGYMVPTHFVPIEALPLNANNKADSKQLAALYNKLSVEDLQRLSYSSRNDKEWNEAEKRVIDVISSVIDVEVSVLSRSSNLYELGLDSISMITFSRALQNAGYENAKLSVVKSNPNIGRLVEAIIAGITDRSKENAYIAATQEMAVFAQRHVVNVCRELGVEASDVESIAPCTPMQEGMIYRFLQSEKALYFNRFQYRLADGVDTERLMSAWSSMVTNLQVLRTKFVATDDGFAQVVLKSSHLSSDEVGDYEMMDKSLALRSPWSFKISSSSHGSIVDLRIFHGIYDGNSMRTILRCLLGVYNASGNVQYGPLFHLSLPHGPLAKVTGAEEFWKNHLKTWSHQSLTERHHGPRDVRVSTELGDLEAFEKVRKNLQVAPQAMIQAAWVSVIQTIISPRLTIGLVTSGRAIDFEGAEKVIGPLFNTVPFHIDIASGAGMRHLIQQCHDFNMKMQDYQHTPLKDIQKWSSVKPGQSLFDTLFVFQRAEMEEENFARELWAEIEDDDDKNIADVSYS
jgi:amino acid adenylation domain-containing protein